MQTFENQRSYYKRNQKRGENKILGWTVVIAIIFGMSYWALIIR